MMKRVDELSRELCTGCMACGDSCPTNAITFEMQKDGFWYPVIKKDFCIECGKCAKVCPINKERVPNDLLPKVYAAWNKDPQIRVASTSGGIYLALAEHFVKNGGYIIGAEYSNDYKNLFHTLYNTNEGLNKLKDSKYFQSDSTGIYESVKNILKSGETVFFCGTPCQVAALNSFLGRSYDKLITCDFVCIGVNSPLAYQKYINYLEKKYNSKVKHIQFKNKTKSWMRFGTQILFENGKVYFADKYKDLFIRGYIEDKLYIRPSCANCQFKGVKYQSDLTMGDFWGIGKNDNNTYADQGTSILMIHTDKGAKVLEQVNTITYYTESLEKAIQGNGGIMNSVKLGKNNEYFFDNIDKLPFDKLIYKCSCRRNLRIRLSILKKQLNS